MLWLGRLFGKSMFKSIKIQLAGPICNCEEEDLWWNTPTRDPEGKPVLEVGCYHCKTMLRVGNDQFKAVFALDKSYPKAKTEKKDAKILQLVPGDKKD